MNVCELGFNSRINYCKEIIGLFNDLRPTLVSKKDIQEDFNQLKIVLSYPSLVAAKEADIVLSYLAAIYYDCSVNVFMNKKLKYNFHVIDGSINQAKHFH